MRWFYTGRVNSSQERWDGLRGRGSVGRVSCSQGGLVRERTQRADDRRQCPDEPLDPPKSAFGRRRLGEDGRLRTAKPCGPGTRCWCQADGGASTQPGFRQSFNPSAEVKRRIRRRGEHGISRKAIAQGMSGYPRLYLYTRVRRCSGIHCLKGMICLTSVRREAGSEPAARMA